MTRPLQVGLESKYKYRTWKVVKVLKSRFDRNAYTFAPKPLCFTLND